MYLKGLESVARARAGGAVDACADVARGLERVQTLVRCYKKGSALRVLRSTLLATGALCSSSVLQRRLSVHVPRGASHARMPESHEDRPPGEDSGFQHG